ncbi:MAG: class I tRNA ligase family protein, partial [Myxococcales bacterium]
ELVKERAYGDSDPASESARATLACALHTSLRLLAPFLPYVTEEVWSWWQDGSVHRSEWPGTGHRADLAAGGVTTTSVLAAVSATLIGIRGAKSQAKVSMRAPLARVEVTGPPALIEAASAAADDLRRAGHVKGDLVFTASEEASEITVAAELAEVTEG